MENFLTGMAGSALVGIVLWALLPRGVVLTRAIRRHNFLGEPLYDTWELRNDSALPIKLTSVAVMSTLTYDETKDRFDHVELTADNESKFAVELRLDDDISEIGRQERETPWMGLIIPPGDTLEAKVLNNTDLVIKYRRPGVTGLLERRKVTIKGNV
jgi:hypothetical protein